MHEGDLAASVASAIRRAGMERRRASVEVAVHGGHDDAAAMDRALRLHLAAELPAFDQARLAISHLPGEVACVTCDEVFSAPDDAPCPACGSPVLPVPKPGWVEISFGGTAARAAAAGRARQPH
jgi:Zn finger protein HypA/HybF involved in hydrogenase expression